MVQAKVYYLLNEEGRRQSLLQGGDGKEVQCLVVDATPDLLQLCRISSEGEAKLEAGFRRDYGSSYLKSVAVDLEIKKTCFNELKIDTIAETQHFNAPQALDDLIAWEKNRRQCLAEKKAELEPEYRRRLAAHKAETARRREREKKDHEQQQQWRAEEKARAAERREHLEQEKQRWIAEHGSDFLRRAVKLNYDCQRCYVQERSQQEFPDFAVDFSRNTDWNKRSCPSERALNIVEKLVAQGLDAQVVWLTNPSADISADAPYDCYGDFEPCEAVVIEGYLRTTA